MSTNPDPTEQKELHEALTELLTHLNGYRRTEPRQELIDFILADRQTQKQKLLARIESEVIGVDEPTDIDEDDE